MIVSLSSPPNCIRTYPLDASTVILFVMSMRVRFLVFEGRALERVHACEFEGCRKIATDVHGRLRGKII